MSYRYRKTKATYCGRKVRYRDRKDVKRARTHLLDNPRNDYLRIYKCERCGGFHLTHQYRPA
jgi:hypothetical protein